MHREVTGLFVWCRWETLWVSDVAHYWCAGSFHFSRGLSSAADARTYTESQSRVQTERLCLLFTVIWYVCRQILSRPLRLLSNRGPRYRSVFIWLFLWAPEEKLAEMSVVATVVLPPPENQEFLRNALLVALFTHHTACEIGGLGQHNIRNTLPLR